VEIEMKWRKPIPLRSGARQGMIYTFEESLLPKPNKAGIYVFARMVHEYVIPLYIGQGGDLKQRIQQQFNNLKLMKGIEKAPPGKRRLMIARVKLRPGQNQDSVLKVAEKACIESALSQGFELLNKQGVKEKVHSIVSHYRYANFRPFPKVMKLKEK